MDTRRRPAQSVYGKGRTVKLAEALWNEAITASPIKPYRKATVESTTTERAALADLDVNRAVSPVLAMKPKLTRASRSPSIADSSSSSSSTELDADEFFASALNASTPIHKSKSHMQPDVSRIHIKFDASESDLAQVTSPAVETCLQDNSSLDSSALSSVPDSEELVDLTSAFGRLHTVADALPEQDQSIASIEELQDIQTLLSLCSQLTTNDFSQYISDIAAKSKIIKIGEASFSEVFLGTCRETGDETVYKIIPFGDGKEEVPINDVAQELRISTAMSSVPGFVQVKGMKIVQGKYPTALLEIWNSWAETHETESDRPDWYDEDQRYCIVALENAGTDLEHYNITTWQEALGLLREIVETLARGESEREFEHRDLHWGNILIRDSEQSGKSKITIIDYTLSRALVHDQLSDIAYYGFSDREIFEAEGDEYQFEIYRLMRDLISDGSDDPADEDWTQFYPSTNALWIHYIVDKLIEAKDLKKPALRTTKRSPTLNEEEIGAWKKLDNLWKLLNPARKYKLDERPIDSARRVLELMQ